MVHLNYDKASELVIEVCYSGQRICCQIVPEKRLGEPNSLIPSEVVEIVRFKLLIVHAGSESVGLRHHVCHLGVHTIEVG